MTRIKMRLGFYAIFILLTFSKSPAASSIALLHSDYTTWLYRENFWGDYDSLHVKPAELLLNELPFTYDVVSDFFIELDSLMLLDYKLLIVPDATSMSLLECIRIENFVRNGGTLFLTGTSSIHDGFDWIYNFGLYLCMGVSWPGFEREISDGSFWNINKMLSGNPAYDAIFKGVFEKKRKTNDDPAEADISIKNGWNDGAVAPVFLNSAKCLAYWTDYNPDSLLFDPRGEQNLACALTVNNFGKGWVLYFNGKFFSGYKYCREIASWAHRDTDPCQNAEKFLLNVIRNYTDIYIPDLDLASWWLQWQHHERSKLVDSYEDGERDTGYNAAFLYDQALAILCYCALAKNDKTNAAHFYLKCEEILRILGRYQNADGSFPFAWIHKDERIKPINTARYTGANAWLLMAMNRFEEQFGDSVTFRGFAKRLADWICLQLDFPDKKCWAVKGGIDASDQQINFRSVEHNLDAYAALVYRGYLTGDMNYRCTAFFIRNWLKTYGWNDSAGHFLRGENDPVLTMDVNPWGVLALGTQRDENRDYSRGLTWSMKNCQNRHDWQGHWDPHPEAISEVNGFDFDVDRDVVWIEGTESMAVALHLTGQDSLARLFSAANDGGLPYATNAGTIAADDPDRPTTYPSVAATAWYIFSELGYNPFETPNQAYSDSCTSLRCPVSSDNDLSFRVFPVYPNPFNSGTSIRFQLGSAALVRLRIFNLNGELVRILTNEKMPQGLHQFAWNAENQNSQPVASGIYFYHLEIGQNSKSSKMILIR